MAGAEDFRRKMDREMRAGFIALALLNIIDESEDPIYGYLIIRRLSEVTEGRMRLKEGTVYPVLRYLQAKDFLVSFLGESPRGAPRKYYRITEEGRMALEEGLEAWRELRDSLGHIFNAREME